MNLGELRTQTRIDSDDRKPPFFSKDDELRAWLNEAEAEAAMRARLIFDDSQRVVLTAGTSRYTLTSLFEITWAGIYREATPAVPPSTPATYATRLERELYLIDRDENDEIYPQWREDRCAPERLIVDDTSVTLPGILASNYQLRLEGYRTPATPMVDNADEPEINPMHHRFLVHWALHRAYSKPDAEIFNPGKAADALKAFEAYFGERWSANQRKRNQASRPHHNRSYF
jgi:hypothetical protein